MLSAVPVVAAFPSGAPCSRRTRAQEIEAAARTGGSPSQNTASVTTAAIPRIREDAGVDGDGRPDDEPEDRAVATRTTAAVTAYSPQPSDPEVSLNVPMAVSTRAAPAPRTAASVRREVAGTVSVYVVMGSSSSFRPTGVGLGTTVEPRRPAAAGAHVPAGPGGSPGWNRTRAR